MRKRNGEVTLSMIVGFFFISFMLIFSIWCVPAIKRGATRLWVGEEKPVAVEKLLIAKVMQKGPSKDSFYFIEVLTATGSEKLLLDNKNDYSRCKRDADIIQYGVQVGRFYQFRVVQIGDGSPNILTAIEHIPSGTSI